MEGRHHETYAERKASDSRSRGLLLLYLLPNPFKRGGAMTSTLLYLSFDAYEPTLWAVEKDSVKAYDELLLALDAVADGHKISVSVGTITIDLTKGTKL